MLGLGNKESGYTVADKEAVELLDGAIVEAFKSKRTDQKLGQMQTQLTHVARVSTLGEMVAGIAHEVNQPLYSIRNFAQATANLLADEEITDFENLRKWNDAISRAATHAGRIVTRLRGFVGQTDSQRTPRRIDELLDEAMQIVTPEAHRHGITVQFEPSENPPTVRVDRIEIQQVLVNLLQNAYEALGQTGAIGQAEAQSREVTVGSATDGQFVEISVVDNGLGLPDDEDFHIFDTFVTTKPDGLGMGLALEANLKP